MLDVVIVTQEEPFYLPVFFRTFFQNLNRDRVRVKRLYLTDAFNESFLDRIRRGYRFFGPIGFLKQGFQYVFRTTFAQFGWVDSVPNLAQKHGVSVCKTENVNQLSTRSEIKELQPDVILSVTAAQVFESDLLELPSWGCVNVHSSKLPKYRGMMPTFWAMFHGDDELGITVHTMEEELDRGKMIRQTTMPIKTDESLSSLIHRSKSRAAELVIEALEDIEANNVELSNITGEGSYHSFPTRDDVREFRKRGNRLI